MRLKSARVRSPKARLSPSAERGIRTPAPSVPSGFGQSAGVAFHRLIAVHVVAIVGLLGGPCRQFSWSRPSRTDARPNSERASSSFLSHENFHRRTSDTAGLGRPAAGPRQHRWWRSSGNLHGRADRRGWRELPQVVSRSGIVRHSEITQRAGLAPPGALDDRTENAIYARHCRFPDQPSRAKVRANDRRLWATISRFPPCTSSEVARQATISVLQLCVGFCLQARGHRFRSLLRPQIRILDPVCWSA